jgi:hypothetical protein
MYHFDPQRVAFARANGLSFVCSLCVKYWRARDSGVPGDQCLAVDGCGSPIAGDDFHEYEGPISPMEKWCFVCGEKPCYGIKYPARPRVLAICERHVPLLAQLQPVRRVGIPLLIDVRDPEHGSRTIAQVLGPPPKSLAAAIVKAEAEIAKDQERKG